MADLAWTPRERAEHFGTPRYSRRRPTHEFISDEELEGRIGIKTRPRFRKGQTKAEQTALTLAANRKAAAIAARADAIDASLPAHWKSS